MICPTVNSSTSTKPFARSHANAPEVAVTTGESKIKHKNLLDTIESLEKDNLREEHKCTSYKGVRLVEVILNRHHSLDD